jgi:hypothetical protein
VDKQMIAVSVLFFVVFLIYLTTTIAKSLWRLTSVRNEMTDTVIESPSLAVAWLPANTFPIDAQSRLVLALPTFTYPLEAL